MSTKKAELSVNSQGDQSHEISMLRDPAAELEFGQKCAKALMDIVESSKKKLVLNGKTYLTFEHWQTVARFFSATAGTTQVNPIKDDSGNIIGFEASAVVRQDDKIIASAQSACMRDEKNWATKPEFQLRSMAQTRACAKALRNAFAWIPVLAGYEGTPAEEMDGVVEVIPNTTPAAPEVGGPGSGGTKPCSRCGTPIDRLPTWRNLCLNCYRADKNAERIAKSTPISTNSDVAPF